MQYIILRYVVTNAKLTSPTWSTNSRESNQIERIDDKNYKVKSQSSNIEYDVIAGERGWLCSCPDHMFRGVNRKHIHAVEFSLELRKKVASEIVIPTINVHQCPQCHSDQIVKNGLRHNKYGDIQIYNCKDCNHYFTINLGFEGMRSRPQVITSAMADFTLQVNHCETFKNS